ncbi:MAG: PorV/PorQ family protein [Elusimicrobiota bacterium]|nr:PorV/PorQ family protein [Elusimicrobiota bacterium]
MRIILLLFTFHISLFTSIRTLYAAASGGQPGQFLQWAAGARSLGMGKAFFSVSDDASATYWNPAGLSQIDRNEVIALHTSLWAGTNYDFISFVYPTAKYGTFGANIIRLFTDGFEKINFSYDPSTKKIIEFHRGGTFSDDKMAFTASYGRKIIKNISIGFAAKLLQRSLDWHKDNMLGLDLSFLMEGLNSHLPGLKLGFGINNLLTQSFNTLDKLPMAFRFGASHKFLRDKITASLDLTKGFKTNLNWAAGVEYWLVNFLAVRVGFDGETGIREFFRESSMGLGFKYKDYGLDYAFALHELGISALRVSGSWRFGKSVIQTREGTVRRLIQEGMEAYRRGNFLVAFNRFEKAAAVDPANKDVIHSIARLQVVIGFIPSATADTEEASGIRKGVSGYVEDDISGAVSALRYAYYKNPQNEKILQLLNAIEKQNNLPLTEPYREGPGGWTIIDKKIYDARQAVMEGRYDQALIRCQEILNLEANHITALEIMGSAFFMMNQPDRAKEVWMKVLELDPTNKIVQEFLEELK